MKKFLTSPTLRYNPLRPRFTVITRPPLPLPGQGTAMDILSFIVILAAGFSGLAAHWYNRYAQGRTTNSFVEYLKEDSKHTLSSILSILATEITVFQSAPVDLTLNALLTAFTYGYTLDSIMNREGQGTALPADQDEPTSAEEPQAVPPQRQQAKPVNNAQARAKPHRSLQEIIDETREK